MLQSDQQSNSFPRAFGPIAQCTLMLACSLALLSTAAQAQYSVIHNFSGADGANPYVGLTMDAAGNLYGTTYNGGNQACSGGCGVVFKLTHSGSGWLLRPLYSFTGGSDGSHPYSRVTIAADGTLYGATYSGGGMGCGGAGCGTVYHLTPPATAPRNALPTWNETVIYRFSSTDGANPQGDLTFDHAGNIYGTTLFGGAGGGVIYELSPSGGSWTQAVLYTTNEFAPFNPTGGVILDADGNLYGVFENGGQYISGAVYELSRSGSGWTEQTIYLFTGGTDGGEPMGGLIFDSTRDLYGTTTYGGDQGNPNGTAFEITPGGGGWIYDAFWDFGPFTAVEADDKLLIDSAGNLYGTTFYNGNLQYNAGTIYELIHTNGGWTETDLHDFSDSDGAHPMSIIVSDANGHLYGTATAGGSSLGSCSGGNGCGVIWEIAR